MRQWLLSSSGDRALSQDEITGIWAMAFDLGGSLYGQVGLRSICRRREARVIVGPFAHMCAFVDVLWGLRQRQTGDEADEAVVFHRVADDKLPRAPSEVPFFRRSMDPMNPFLAAELLWRAQTALDANEDVDIRLAVFEQAYGGSKADPKSRASYEEEADYDLPANAPLLGGKPKNDPEPGRIEGSVPQAVPVGPNGLTIPVPVGSGLRASRTVAPLTAAATGSAREEPIRLRREQARPKPVPAAVDWSALPVCVVEQRITDGFSYLKARPRVG